MGHTKGPWTLDGADILAPETRFRSKDLPIAMVSVESEQWPQNAALISTAPEMLAHLEYLLEKIDFKGQDPVEFGMIQSIIKKAKGEL